MSPTIALDAALAMDDIAQVDAVAGAAESVGFAALWANETKRNPFIQLALAARATSRILLGTGVAIAFPRSPTVMAHLAWDLAASAHEFEMEEFLFGSWYVCWGTKSTRIQELPTTMEHLLAAE